MKDLSINGARREETGTGPSSRLRREGRVPAVAYGKSKEPTQISVDSRELAVVLRELGNSTPLVKIKEGKSKASTSIIQEIQRHPITDRYLHVDFREVADDEQVVLEVPVHSRGEPWGVKNESGTLEYVSHSVSVRALPKNIPDFIDCDVSELRVGDLIHIKELPELEGVEYLDHAEQPVFTVIA
ncbi:MAG: 50S ribosomal protein L25 [Opitutales bacterium]|nr:50S ribosomal protein L25 [Opitutales bacterium]